MQIGRAKAIGLGALSKVATSAIAAFVSTIVIFAALYLSPGDPISSLVGQQEVSPEVLANLKAQYGLDDPPITRYFTWLGHVLQGDLGTSIQTKRPVTEMIADALPVTAMLLVYALLLVVLIGLAGGFLAALKPGRVSDAIVAVTGVIVATPAYAVGILLVAVLAVQLKVFPVFGQGEGGIDRIWHLTLPAIALALPYAAYVARVTRASLLGEWSAEHVQTGRARGLPESRIIRRHIVRNAMTPTITTIGLVLVSLVAGAVVVERVFGLNGIGSVLLHAVSVRDLPVVQGVLLVFVIVVCLVNMLIDLLPYALDPRLRRS